MYPSIEYLSTFVKDYKYLPVMKSFNADLDTPISIFKSIREDAYSFLLESVEGEEKMARFSFIGKKPFMRFEAYGKDSYIIYPDIGKVHQKGNPLDILSDLIKRYSSPRMPDMPRFCGGALGFTSYDAVRFIEHLPDIPLDELKLPDLHYLFYNEVIVFDHVKQKIDIVVNIDTEKSIDDEYERAAAKIEKIYREIINNKQERDLSYRGYNFAKLKLKATTSQKEYFNAVNKAKEYIIKGDIFQVVLSQRFSAEINKDPFDIYRDLRIINPSSYMFYIDFKEYTLAGASPEMLLRVENGEVETCPIAGTRKRDRDSIKDEALEEELLNDEKESAEHVMLVDLGRNDIGKVSEFGSVKVVRFKQVQRYSHVMHLVSNVKGKLKKGTTAIDALKAVFPAGTLSGAPKVRAMEIIDELEKVKRGAYGGAAGYIGFDGNLDHCITIRTILFMNNRAYLQVGAGIVHDSDPVAEYDECLNKARALFKALEGVNRY